jgi:hypothetical protein
MSYNNSVAIIAKVEFCRIKLLLHDYLKEPVSFPLVQHHDGKGTRQQGLAEGTTQPRLTAEGAATWPYLDSGV